MDGQTYGRTDNGHLTHVIKSTLRSRPNNNTNAAAADDDEREAYIMRSDVDVTKSLRLTVTDAVHVLPQNVLKPRVEHLQQCVPVSDTATTLCLAIVNLIIIITIIIMIMV